MNRTMLILLALLILSSLWWSQSDPFRDESHVAMEEASAPEPASKLVKKNMDAAKPRATEEARPRPVERVTQPSTQPKEQASGQAFDEPEEHSGTIAFVVEDGLAVTQGDIVLGLPPDSGALQGRALEPELRLWPTRVIPYHIQPYLSRPERVEAALEFFRDTVIEFVPFQGHEEHALVFEEGTGACKSYVGHIGGHQPIWLSPGCEAAEVAHEILHALGFVHEQNRWDRDQYIEVLMENVEAGHEVNFEKFSPDMMQVSGLTPFDYRSIMLYPASMFARGGQVTMRSLQEDRYIDPSRELSPLDVERINRAYGGLY